ncbi:endonuclease/exonuclease/phosphatase family protein [Saccharicrinis fermentans]|uniref:Endonuclease/Exonuclease/phosphatase family protein n=1 Tax=Saccharicrinis fermentans DSM 9555 = JCM 21142 TaxID=869213 RepID=W7Y0M4_9BACT|nr:hypothetical protein [Saccharicrinis fermentans]GAF01502.1 endonuclease/Exonuclease/phosphatase family protein [Saccharicrinis fermentans DSM 9555 = JCM 21142]
MRYLVFIFLLTLIFNGCKSTSNPKETQQTHVIAFYNLENLFDTIDDRGIFDEEFTPGGSKAWNTQRYRSKLNNLSKVIADLGADQGMDGPSLIGVSEVENRTVLEDLIHTDHLKDKGYAIVHFDSPDKRGIDVGLLYKASAFSLSTAKIYPLFIRDNESGERLYTRDQLLVTGKLNGDRMHIIVNHWPSRYGGQERSIASRKAAALLNRHIIDSLLLQDVHAKIITMGDLNDNPTDVSVSIHLDAHVTKKTLNQQALYNPLAKNFIQGNGTLYYKGTWNLFDQLVISQGFLNPTHGYEFDSVYIYHKPYLIQKEGDYKGYLLRTYGGSQYLNGYSDHLPVYMVLSSVKD